MNFAIACLVIVKFVNFATAQDVGDICNHKETGTQGICKYPAECDVAVQAIRRGLHPQLCGFAGQQPIVCCPGEPVDKGTRRVGQISKEKCKEYTKYIWQELVSPILKMGPSDTIRISGCPFNATELIVGGTAASRREFPHMVLIGYDAGEGEIKWACGGSLISEQFVLTAAHCLSDRQLGDAKYANMGIVDIDDELHLQHFTIIERIRHPSYTPPKLEYDVALLKLNSAAKLNTYVRPACLYTENHTPESKAIATGWGKTANWGEGSKILLKVVLNFYGRDHCNTYFKLDRRLNEGIDDNSMVCAGSPEENKDTCQGDSGGPLQIYNNEFTNTNCMYDIVGITSFGAVCAYEPNATAVYTRVSYFVEWIENIVWPPS